MGPRGGRRHPNPNPNPNPNTLEAPPSLNPNPNPNPNPNNPNTLEATRAHRKQTEEYHRNVKAEADRNQKDVERTAKEFEKAKANDLKLSGEAAASQAAVWEETAEKDRAASVEAQATYHYFQLPVG